MDKKHLPLSLCLICKDETIELDRCLASIRQFVSEVIAGWNGTNPETKAILEKYNCKIIPFEWQNDFAKARQLTFDNATNDLVLWMDADDTFEHPESLLDLLDFFQDHRLGALWLFYDYEQDEYGNTTMAVWRERILRRKWFKWSGVVHEEALRQLDCIQSKVQIEKCYIKHHITNKDLKVSGERNLVISKTQYDKEHKADDIDAVNVWNYAKSLNACGFIEEALPIFSEFVQLTGSDAHRYQAYTEIAKIHRKLHQFDQALDSDLMAIKMKPQWPYAYFGMANTYFCLEDWKNVIFYTELGFRCKDPSDSQPIAYDPLSITVRPLQPLVYALVQEGRFKDAQVATNKALQFIPKSQYFLNWQKSIEELLKKEKTEQYCLELYEQLKEEGNGKLELFTKALPESVKDHPVFVRLANQFRSNVTQYSNRIVIYCGASVEYWDALSVKEGIGGSEEAVIYLSRYLVKLGWNVEVYNNCLDEGNYDGVLWQGFWKYDAAQPCSVFIAWRDPNYIKFAPQDSFCCLWLHDTIKMEHFMLQELKRVDKIFVLSKWHRTCLPDIPEDKFYYTHNGIISSQFDEIVTRDPYSCIYASSPDRGLDILLEQWPQIKKEVPDAILHVYYGFTKNYDEIHKNDLRMKQFKTKVMGLLKQDGIIYHGRVSHQELTKSFLGCGLWFYPTYFTEISCITAMKAQTAGCIPITTSMAALEETVKFGVKIEDKVVRKTNTYDYKPDEITITVPEIMRDEWTKQAIYYLKHPEEQEEIRKPMMVWAREHFDWKHIAVSWDGLFKQHNFHKQCMKI